MADTRYDLLGHDCERCGRPHPGPDYNGEPGFCCAPWLDERDHECERLYIAKLEADRDGWRAQLSEAKRGLAAWEALAFHVADKGGAIDCLREDGSECVLFVGDWQSARGAPTEAALWLTREMKLIPEAK